MPRIVVTGGAGFIGSHVVAELLCRGSEILVIDNLSTGNLGHVPAGARVGLIPRDVHEVGADELGSEVRAIVHLAAVASVQQSWEAPSEVQHCNLGSTLKVVDWARRLGVPRIVFASSAAVYGPQQSLPIAEAASTTPLSPYGLHKLAGETYLRLFAQHCGFSAVSLRYFNVYGPRQSERSDYSGVVSRFARAFLEGRRIELHGGGVQTRDFIYVRDVARATARALELPLARGEHRCFNIGTQQSVSVAQLADALECASGRKVSRTMVDTRSGDIPHSLADIGAARAALDFAPSVGLTDGLAEYLAWMESERATGAPLQEAAG